MPTSMQSVRATPLTDLPQVPPPSQLAVPERLLWLGARNQIPSSTSSLRARRAGPPAVLLDEPRDEVQPRRPQGLEVQGRGMVLAGVRSGHDPVQQRREERHVDHARPTGEELRALAGVATLGLHVAAAELGEGLLHEGRPELVPPAAGVGQHPGKSCRGSGRPGPHCATRPRRRAARSRCPLASSTRPRRAA